MRTELFNEVIAEINAVHEQNRILKDALSMLLHRPNSAFATNYAKNVLDSFKANGDGS